MTNLDADQFNKIFIDLIGKVEENRLEIKMLKESDRIKNEIIESLKKEIKLIKEESEDLTQQMEIGDRNLWKKFDEIQIEIKNKCNKDELLKEFDEKVDMKMNARYCDMKEEWNEEIDEKIEKLREENEKSDMERSNQIDKYLNMRDWGRLDWQIGKINEIKLIESELFYDNQSPYKMNLQLQNINNELEICLYIYSGACDDDLKWPCEAYIKIGISALNDNSIYKTETKSCKIEKPETDSSKCGDPIKFSHSDLTKSNLLNISCLLICSVEFN